MCRHKRLGPPALALSLVLMVFASVKVGPLLAEQTDVENQAEQTLSQAEVSRGICVLLASEPAELATAMARKSELTIYVQLPTEEAVAKARKRIAEAGLLGTRVYVEKGSWRHIHLADNLADALVMPTPPAITPADRDEYLRVVRPLGKILLAGQPITKPYPAGVDHWTHAYKGPDNNPQSNDQLARAPYLTQFLSEPWYVPFPEVTVTSAGRVFKAFGHVGYKRRDWPWVNTLVALGGFNGTVLWKRPLEEGFNIHRNTMIATPEILYVADSKSCRLLDTATGEVKDEITAPDGATGPVWKWMAMEDGVLYAMVGQQEMRDPTLRGTRTDAGWPWAPMTKGYDDRDYPWGFGRTLLAIDLGTKQVLWMHKEDELLDGRAVAMSSGRIFCYAQEKFLVCLDAETGRPVWRASDPKLLQAIGSTLHAQRPDWGFNSSSYLKCSDKAVYFAGPQRQRLVAVSAEDGKMLWQYPHGNYQLVLRDEGLYAMGRTGPSKLLDPLTGRVLADIGKHRGNCTRATGAIDAIFTRGPGHGGTMRLAVAGNQPQRIALMRPDCHDGVIISNGLLYWGPWMCDCSLSLVGIICLGPAGDFDFRAEATDAERLEPLASAEAAVQPLRVGPGDWPAYRADNQRNAASAAAIPADPVQAWQYTPPAAIDSAAPVTAGGLVFLSGADGVVRALDGASGDVRWTGYTGGSINYPPAIDDGRVFVGSGDGRVYVFEAATGRPLWRFRAAPAERKINVYGKLASTWPVASGVLVGDGVVYAAAGIASYDGTHVYALDAATGKIRWQNNTSGHLAGDDTLTGVSVQGHLLMHRDRLYLAGGNVVSPAVYDVRDGRCLNRLEDEWAKAPRGREMFVVGDKVIAFEQLLYSPEVYWPGRYFAGHLVQARQEDVLIRGSGGRIARIDRATATEDKPKAIWQSQLLKRCEALALGRNAMVIAGTLPSSEPDNVRCAVVAVRVEDGSPLWSRPLPAMPVSWGLALDDAGRIVIALEDGRALCLAAKQ